MRFAGKSRLGFYPLPLSEARRIRTLLQFPDVQFSAIDPCVGDGVAFEVITNGAEVLRYGVELDSFRAEQAKQRIPNVVQGNTLEVHCQVECFGLLYLNPPYDWTLGPAHNRRTEHAFLSHTYRWLKPGAILVFVIPVDRLAECSQILASHFRDVRVYRLESPECVRYKQVVVIAQPRPWDPQWARNIRDLCKEKDIPFYFGQIAGKSRYTSHLLDGVEYNGVPPLNGPHKQKGPAQLDWSEKQMTEQFVLKPAKKLKSPCSAWSKSD